jgi:hypothetical protein
MKTLFITILAALLFALLLTGNAQAHPDAAVYGTLTAVAAPPEETEMWGTHSHFVVKTGRPFKIEIRDQDSDYEPVVVITSRVQILGSGDAP